MKKAFPTFMLILQMALNPSFCFAGTADTLASPSQTSGIMPEAHPTQDAESQIESLNGLISLIGMSPESAQPALVFNVNLEPLLPPQSIRVTVDPTTQSATWMQSAGNSLNGTYDSNNQTASFNSGALKNIAAFEQVDGKLILRELTSRLIGGGDFSMSATYRLADDGTVRGYTMDWSSAGVQTHIELNLTSGGNWRSDLSITDKNNKVTEAFQGWMSGASVRDLSHQGLETQVSRVKDSALTKMSFYWGGRFEVQHLEKDAGGNWVTRLKTVSTPEGLKNLIMEAGPQGSGALFIQNQTVAGLPGFSVTYGASWTDEGYQGYGLIFASADRQIVVNYPSQYQLELDGNAYRIILGADGRLTLESLNTTLDFNNDGRMDDADVDWIADAAANNRFESRLDLNSDGKVDQKDVRIAGDRYVDELRKTNTVILVDPSMTDALTHARDAVRLLTAGGMTQNVIVLIREGEYFETSFELDSRDSGKNGYQVIYRGYPGQEKPQIMGGRELDSSAWQKAPEFAGNVYKIDLNANGVAPQFNTVFVDGEAASNSKSDRMAVVDIPTQNNLMTLFPEAKQSASYDGSKTIVRTWLPSNDGMRPLREEHFFGVNMTLDQINARRAADPTFVPNHIDSYSQFVFAPGTLTPDMDIEGAMAEMWTYEFYVNYIKIKNVDWEKRIITLESPAAWTIEKNLSADGTYVVAGIHSFMDVHEDHFAIQGSKAFLSEGEYFYSGGVLYYKAAEGQTMSDKKVVIPTSKQVLSVKGTEADPVHDIVFDRLDISVSEAVSEFKNNTIAQDRYFLPEEMSALYFKNTRDITIQNSLIHATGAVGLLFDGVSVGNRVVDNVFMHIGADGLVINGDQIPTTSRNATYRPKLVSHDNVISGNEIGYVGDVFLKSDGIRLVQSADNLVSDNHIHHIGFSGIFLIGMQEYLIATRSTVKLTRDKDDPNYDLYYEFNLANNNQFINNEINDICLYSSDGAAFYTHSAGKNNVISGNDIHDIYHGLNLPPLNIYWASAYGIYLDGGQSDYFTITNNRIYNINTELGMPMSINGSYNIITGNVTEQKNSSAPIQFISGWGFAQRGNVLENNTFKNLDPKGKLMMRLWQYLTYPYRDGMAVPEGGFLVNKKTKASDPDNWVLYVPAPTFASNDNNTYDFASHEYNVFTDWSNLTTFVSDGSVPNGGYLKTVLKAWVPYTEWTTVPLAGYTRVFDKNSIFI